MYTPDEAKGGKRGIPYSVEVAKEPDEDASGESGSDSGEEEVEGAGGVETEPKAAAAAEDEVDDLLTHLQLFFVDEFGNDRGEITNMAILHLYGWGPQLIPRWEYVDAEDGGVVTAPTPRPPPFDLCDVSAILDAIDDVKFGIRR